MGMKQKTLFKLSDYTSEFGGELLEGKRKTRRPLSINLSHHIILDADITDCGSLVKHQQLIRNILREHARKFNVFLHEISVNSNHCHLHLQFQHRNFYLGFIRTVTASLRKELNVRWHLRPYSRMVTKGREFQNVNLYVERNQYEANGTTVYKRRRAGVSS